MCIRDRTRINDASLPRNVYVNPGNTPVGLTTTIKDAIDDINTTSGIQIYAFNANPRPTGANGYDVIWSVSPYGYGAEFVGDSGPSCAFYPAGEIYIALGDLNPDRIRKVATHELEHGLGFFEHSPFEGHMIFNYIDGTNNAKSLTQFEGKTIHLLYWLKDGTDLGKYDKLPE